MATFHHPRGSCTHRGTLMPHRLARPALSIAVALVIAFAFNALPRAAADGLPAALSDAEFWALTEQISEANGYFQSDNLTSNEMTLSEVAAQLAERVKPDGVYLGVGPEQNYT